MWVFIRSLAERVPTIERPLCTSRDAHTRPLWPEQSQFHFYEASRVFSKRATRQLVSGAFTFSTFCPPRQSDVWKLMRIFSLLQDKTRGVKGSIGMFIGNGTYNYQSRSFLPNQINKSWHQHGWSVNEGIADVSLRLEPP